MGWIRHGNQVINTATVSGVLADDDKLKIFEVGYAEAAAAVVEIDGGAEAELDRLVSWLTSGAEGVYVVGEGPMGTADVRNSAFEDGLKWAHRTVYDMSKRFEDRDKLVANILDRIAYDIGKAAAK